MDRGPGWYDDPQAPGVRRWWTGTNFDADKIMRAPGIYEGPEVPSGRARWTGTSWVVQSANSGARVSLRSVVIAGELAVAMVGAVVVWKVSSSPGTLVPVTVVAVTEAPHSQSACLQLGSLSSFISRMGPLVMAGDASPVSQVDSYGTQGIVASEGALDALGRYAGSIEGLSASQRVQLAGLGASLIVAQKDFSAIPGAALAAAGTKVQGSRDLNTDVFRAEVAARKVQTYSEVVSGLAAGCPA